MPFQPMAENKHWRDNRMYFGLGSNWYYQKALNDEFNEDPQGFARRDFWLWVDKQFLDKDVNVVWCNVYKMYALHFITDEAKIEFLLKYGKEENVDWDGMIRTIKLPIIRKIIPSAIASEILGVQPMTAPTGLFASLRTRYGDEDDE